MSLPALVRHLVPAAALRIPCGDMARILYIYTHTGIGSVGENQMRTKFVETTKRALAVKAMPWASKIVKVEGGYRGWESWSDYQTWRNQR